MKRLLAPTLALVLTACGGGGGSSTSQAPPAYAKVLNYTDPVSSGFRLVADPSTNGTSHLVLNLVGPAGTAVRGAVICLATDPALARWGSPGGTQPFARAGNVLDLTQGPDASSQMFKSLLSMDGAQLQVGIFQKTGTVALPSGGVLVSVALDLASAAAAPGTAVLLGPVSGKNSEYFDGQALQPMNGGNPGAVAMGVLVAE